MQFATLRLHALLLCPAPRCQLMLLKSLTTVVRALDANGVVRTEVNRYSAEIIISCGIVLIIEANFRQLAAKQSCVE